jgi:hypothetical protein
VISKPAFWKGPNFSICFRFVSITEAQVSIDANREQLSHLLAATSQKFSTKTKTQSTTIIYDFELRFRETNH